jgi:hypothetical protein
LLHHRQEVLQAGLARPQAVRGTQERRTYPKRCALPFSRLPPARSRLLPHCILLLC